MNGNLNKQTNKNGERNIFFLNLGKVTKEISDTFPTAKKAFTAPLQFQGVEVATSKSHFLRNFFSATNIVIWYLLDRPIYLKQI